MKKSGKETTEIRFIELGNMNLCLFQNEMYFLHPSLFLNPFSNILIPFFCFEYHISAFAWKI